MSYWCHTVTLTEQSVLRNRTMQRKITKHKHYYENKTRFKVEDVWRKVFWIYAGSFTRFLVVAGVLLVVLEALRVVEEVLWVF